MEKTSGASPCGSCRHRSPAGQPPPSAPCKRREHRLQGGHWMIAYSSCHAAPVRVVVPVPSNYGELTASSSTTVPAPVEAAMVQYTGRSVRINSARMVVDHPIGLI